MTVNATGFTIEGDANLSGNATDGYTIVDPKATTQVVLAKVADDEAATPLTGAVFSLGIGDDNASNSYPDSRSIDMVSGSSINISDLTVGTKYMLTETKAPDGYIFDNRNYYFQITLNGVVQIIDEDGNVIPSHDRIGVSGPNSDGVYTITVKNTPGNLLPVTGGPGTTPMTVVGLAMVILATAALLLGRRSRAAALLLGRRPRAAARR